MISAERERPCTRYYYSLGVLHVRINISDYLYLFFVLLVFENTQYSTPIVTRNT